MAGPSFNAWRIAYQQLSHIVDHKSGGADIPSIFEAETGHKRMCHFWWTDCQHFLTCEVESPAVSGNVLKGKSYVCVVARVAMHRCYVEGPALDASDILRCWGLRSRGTQRYMAPELFTTGELTFQSDVFAFGVLLFEVMEQKLWLEGECYQAVKSHY